jgi:hypothetical protein
VSLFGFSEEVIWVMISSKKNYFYKKIKLLIFVELTALIGVSHSMPVFPVGHSHFIIL